MSAQGRLLRNDCPSPSKSDARDTMRLAFLASFTDENLIEANLAIAQGINEGLLVWDGQGIKLTKKGFDNAERLSI